MTAHINKLQQKTKRFALEIIKFVDELPKLKKADVIGGQLLRSGTSVGANYRAACRAKSQADFIYKMGIVEEEADESLYWLELLVEGEIMNIREVKDLMEQANEILAMTVSSIRTARESRIDS
ncbi:MAG: four helix bundle protein [Candidatus Omnitrophica bacterium]|nr:four helix bundle protein [Candidatus Omnitrophota bacterium]